MPSLPLASPVTFLALRSAGGERIRDLGAIEAFVSQTNAPSGGRLTSSGQKRSMFFGPTVSTAHHIKAGNK